MQPKIVETQILNIDESMKPEVEKVSVTVKPKPIKRVVIETPKVLSEVSEPEIVKEIPEEEKEIEHQTTMQSEKMDTLKFMVSFWYLFIID